METEYICEWNACGSKFTDLKIMRKHLMEKHLIPFFADKDPKGSNDPYRCEWTNCTTELTSNINNLYIHIRNIHLGAGKKVKCVECGGVFIKLDDLRKHEETHKTEAGKGSAPEKKIKIILERYGIQFIHDLPIIKNIKSPPNINGTEGVSKYDFILRGGHSQNLHMIEYDGEHHFRIVTHGGTDTPEKIMSSFYTSEENIIKDSLKNIFCEVNNYNLLRIHFLYKSDIEKLVEDWLLSMGFITRIYDSDEAKWMDSVVLYRKIKISEKNRETPEFKKMFNKLNDKKKAKILVGIKRTPALKIETNKIINDISSKYDKMGKKLEMPKQNKGLNAPIFKTFFEKTFNAPFTVQSKTIFDGTKNPYLTQVKNLYERYEKIQNKIRRWNKLSDIFNNEVDIEKKNIAKDKMDKILSNKVRINSRIELLKEIKESKKTGSPYSGDFTVFKSNPKFI